VVGLIQQLNQAGPGVGLVSDTLSRCTGTCKGLERVAALVGGAVEQHHNESSSSNEGALKKI
jgi:hypothetical protein